MSCSLACTVVYSSCSLDLLWIVFYFHFILLYRVFRLYLYMSFLDHMDLYMSFFVYRLYSLNLIIYQGS